MTALTVSKRGTITFPASLRRKLGLRKVAGVKLQIEEREDGVLLRHMKKTVSPDLPDLRSGVSDRSAKAMALRAAFIEQVRREYTQKVCQETLRINEELPIHDDVP
jgi:bifunctional DNA-binding transcriptional regulator/antitoxin component of YhaV-PrlF toxin-antitoxin module